METKEIIRIEGLKKIYNGHAVLDIDNYTFRHGIIYGLVGPNGSGKSTLLSIISLLLSPTSGRIYYNGRDSSQLDPSHVRRDITLVHQEPVMFRSTVKKNVGMGLLYRRHTKRDIKKEVKRALEMVGLTRFEGRNARTLSGGEKKRAAIARGLALSPKVLILDEPTANVDGKNVTKIEEIIKSINEIEKTTIIFSTHNIDQAYRISDEILTLMDGRPQTQSIKNFFSGTQITIDGEPSFDTGKLSIKLSDYYDDVNYISIDPKDIIISMEEISSSARNQFQGEIIEIIKDGEIIGVTISTGEDFRVDITRRSFEEMGLNIGKIVYIAFKASAVVTY